MKITSIELNHIAVPFAVPYKLSKKYGTLTHAHAVIFQVKTDNGLVGLGEADPMNPFTEETPATVMAVAKENIAPLLMGLDPRDIPLIEMEINQRVSGNLCAKGGVNMALHDIAGKAYGVPVYALLGGLRHKKLPLLGAIGSGTPETDKQAIEAFIKTGHKTIMIKMGALPIDMEIQRMRAAREHFGNDVFFVVDANQAWTVFEALEFVDGCREWMPDLIEQPVACHDITGLKRIKAASSTPISADESLKTSHDAKTLIREQAMDVVSIKVSKNGGISSSKQIADTLDLFGHGCLMNSMLEFGITQAASLQLGVTLKNLIRSGHCYGSVLRMSDDISDFAKNISNGEVMVPMSPGLGVSLNREKLKKYTLTSLKVD